MRLKTEHHNLVQGVLRLQFRDILTKNGMSLLLEISEDPLTYRDQDVFGVFIENCLKLLLIFELVTKNTIVIEGRVFQNFLTEDFARNVMRGQLFAYSQVP